MQPIQKQSVLIDYLKNHKDLIKTCAHWSFSEWGKHTPERTLDDYIASREEYALHDKEIPLTIIAFIDETPVGMCSIAKTRGILPDLTPWLATLYVVPSLRGNGIAGILEEKMCAITVALGYEKIYCFTSDRSLVPWYQAHGWTRMGKDRVHNHEVTVMEKDLSFTSR